MYLIYVCICVGNPETMQEFTSYDDMMTEILDYFIRRKSECIRMGLKDLIIDPGFGFAKTIRAEFSFYLNI